MLVLSRKAEEELVIGGRIRVKVVAVGRRRTTLGISAPEEVSVRRGEVAGKNALWDGADGRLEPQDERSDERRRRHG